MKETYTFIDIDKSDPSIIGAGHQILGITHNGKYVLGKTYYNPSIGKVQYTNMDYAIKITVLN